VKIEKISDKIVYMDNMLTKRVLFNEKKVLNFVLNFRPGQGVPPHNHVESDLIIHVLTGEGEMTVDNTPHHITTGDVIYCTGSEIFSLTNTGSENMSCFVILAPNPPPQYSKEL
jgi:quercetin dioxygenase-like cupin family protein